MHAPATPPATSPRRRWLHPRTLGNGLFGILNLGSGLGLLILSAVRAETAYDWFSGGLASGLLSYLVSSVLFGIHLIWAAYRGTIRHHTNIQYLVFTPGFLLLAYGYWAQQHTLSLAVLSWAIFFLIDDWLIMEHYLFGRGQRMTPSHYLRLVGVDAVIILTCCAALYEFRLPTPGVRSVLGVAVMAVIGVVFWGEICRSYWGFVEWPARTPSDPHATDDGKVDPPLAASAPSTPGGVS